MWGEADEAKEFVLHHLGAFLVITGMPRLETPVVWKGSITLYSEHSNICMPEDHTNFSDLNNFSRCKRVIGVTVRTSKDLQDLQIMMSLWRKPAGVSSCLRSAFDQCSKVDFPSHQNSLGRKLYKFIQLIVPFVRRLPSRFSWTCGVRSETRMVGETYGSLKLWAIT